MFNFDSSYQDRDVFGIFDPEKDEFIGFDPNYHVIANKRFMGNGKWVPETKNVLLNFYTQSTSQNKTVTVNKNIWYWANPKKKTNSRLCNFIGISSLQTIK